MIRNFQILIALLVCSTCISQYNEREKELNVLFVGNSLTYFHDMPQMLQSMLNETHPHIKIEQITFPGMQLSAHLDNIIEASSENRISARIKKEGELTETEMKLSEKIWDVVVLQNGTIGFLIPNTRRIKIEPAIQKIKKLVKNPNCTYILFETWPSKGTYPKHYCHPFDGPENEENLIDFCSPEILNLDQELKLIEQGYALVAKNTNVTKTTNASKFFEIVQKYPEINLYEDNFHPSAEGSFLNACVFYNVLTNSKASKLEYIGTIAPRTAQILKEISQP